MSDQRFEMNDTASDRPDATAADSLLPPVEPPSAGFIIQLFVVPALIVLLIVSIWLAFNWLVRSASRPEDVIRGLVEGPSVARWQRANELADMLRNERFAEFKRDERSAGELARILDREIAGAAMEENDVEFRKYLARALGEFQVQEGMDVLLKAATTSRDEREQRVRDGALQAIAVRAYNLQQLDPPQQIENPNVESTLLSLAQDKDPLIRFQTAYALGQLGTPAAIERLEVLADDPDADTRFNAAVALAHRGNAKSVETLAEMIDLEEHASASKDANDKTRGMTRSVIVHTAIEATLALAKQNPEADLAPAVEMLTQLSEADDELLEKSQLPPQARFAAERALKSLRRSDGIPPKSDESSASKRK
jgi:HEAT repeat protein